MTQKNVKWEQDNLKILNNLGSQFSLLILAMSNVLCATPFKIC